MRRALEKYSWDKAENERLELVKQEEELVKQEEELVKNLSEIGMSLQLSEDGHSSSISFDL